MIIIKKSIVKILVILGFICNSSLLAMTASEYKEVADSFKLVDTSDKELFQIFKINGEEIKLDIEKNNIELVHTEIQHIITGLAEPKYGTDIYKYDQKVFAVACIAKDKKTVLSSIHRSSVKRTNKVSYSGLVSAFDENTGYGNLKLVYIYILYL